MYALQPLKPMMAVNFPNDKTYTANSLQEELILTEKHTRDQSWAICRCISEKHLVAISALASEGLGFAESPEEKSFMSDLMVRARVFRDDIKKGNIKNQQDYEVIRAWSRQMRHRLNDQNWAGEWSRFESPEMIEVVQQIHALTGDIASLEGAQVDKILTKLSEKHGVNKPPFRFIDQCNPMKDAFMVGSDAIIRHEDGEVSRIPLTDMDELVFCTGGASPYAIAHEFCHYKDRVKTGTTNEKTATECALEETGNKNTGPATAESLYRLSAKESSGGILVSIKKITDKVSGSLPLIGGVVVGEAIDASGMIDNAIAGFTGGFTGLAKGIIGALIVGTGLSMKKGAVADVVIGAGLPIAASGFVQQFLPGGVALGRARATTVMPVSAPVRLTSFARPTGLRMGHPTLSVPMIPPRPGVLAPSGIPASLAGKFILGAN